MSYIRYRRAVEQVAALVANRQLAPALKAALEIWRASVHPRHAAVVEAIAANIELPSLPRGGIQAAWENTRVGDPVMFGALLKALTRSVPIATEVLPWRPNAARKRVAAWGKRIARLEKWPADPRTTMALVEVLQKPPWEMGDPFTGDGLYGRVILRLVGLGDIRAKPLLEKLVAEPTAKTKNLRDYFATKLPAVAANLREPAPLDAAAEQACANVLAALGVNQRVVSTQPIHDHALLEAVLADFRADAPRAVLGDHWLERGDPRGELVALQLDPTHDPKRVKALVKHDTWLGADLRRVTKLRTYRRGFLDEITLLGSSVADKPGWARAAADPGLATVRRINRGDGSEACLQLFVTSPAMRSLESIPVTTKTLPGLMQVRGLTLDLSVGSGELIGVLGLVGKRCPALRSLALVQTAEELAQLPSMIARWPGRTKLAELGVEIGTYRTRGPVVAWLNADLGLPLFVVHPARFRQTYARIAMRAGRTLELDLDEPDLAVFETVAQVGKVNALAIRVASPQRLIELRRWKAGLKRLAPEVLELPMPWRKQLGV